MNASAGKAVADFVGVERDVAKTALQNFAGTWRRFEYKGEVNGAKIYDDYGHHPTEIKATIQGARELYPDKKITLVFQSHTYTRTHELFDNFVEALGHADRVIVLPIYAAREENESGVSHTQLVNAIQEKNPHALALALDTFDEAVREVKAHANTNDIIIVMGAGDITMIASRLTDASSVVS